MKLWIQGTEQGLLEFSDLLLEAIGSHTAERPQPGGISVFVRCEPTVTGGSLTVWFDLDGSSGDWKGDPKETLDWRWAVK